jgi:phosphopantothenoylcysteine decarboxylase/phosphopantothenate--cysteine ligase
MGFALAEAARRRGAEVLVVAGAGSTGYPEDLTVVRADSANEMYEAVMKELPDATVFIGAAAVTDYRPVQQAASKIKKTEESITLAFERTRDILTEVASTRTNGLLVVGFAAETNDVLTNAREKLLTKDLDVIVANDVSRTDSGFDSDMNAITILSRDTQNAQEFPLMQKIDAAHHILDEVVRLRTKTKRSK